MRTNILALVLFCLSMFGCFGEEKSSPPQKLAQDKPTLLTSMTLRIGVWDLTENNPIHTRAEIWIRGVGSKYLKKAPFLVGKYPVGVKQNFFFYPESRKGKELIISFMMTEDMNPNGSARDTLWVSFYDEEVEVSGRPITAATGKSELKFKRK